MKLRSSRPVARNASSQLVSGQVKPSSVSTATNTIAATCSTRKVRLRIQFQRPAPARIRAKPPTTNNTKRTCTTRIVSASHAEPIRSSAPRCSRLPRFDRPRGIGAPFAPGPGIEARPAQAGDFHGEEVVAGGHARTAVAHDVFRARGTEYGTEFLFERFRRLETPVCVEVVPEIPVARTGNAPAHGIERFVLSAKTIRCARVDENQARIVEAGADKICTDPVRVCLPRKPRRLWLRHLGCLRSPFGDPLVPAAVEHRHGQMPQPA